MNIALIGYGQMGIIIEGLLKRRGHTVITVDPYIEAADQKEISEEVLSNVKVCIDFSHPESVVDNMKKLLALGKNVVVGTTGWYDQIDEIRTLVEESGTGFIYASNFSVGVNIFFQIVSRAAKIIDKFEHYDVAGVEFHHNKKQDSPSGTALTLAHILKNSLERKESIVFDSLNRQIKSSELHFSSVRCGALPGTHEIILDSEEDSISLKHTARNRNGFALGAVTAAEWIEGKTGFFTIDDLMKDLIE